MKLSIVLVSYNTQKLTIPCIESIYKYCKVSNFEIILVDNSSDDDTVLLVKEYFPNVIVIQSEVNLGFGKANNEAFKIAKGEYVFLLNTDTIIIDDSIQRMIVFLDQHKDISVVGARLINKMGQEMHSYSMTFPSIKWELNQLLYPISNYFHLIKNRTLKKSFVYVAYITGADMMIRRQDLNEVGYFDEKFFMYFEETDLSYRFAMKSFRQCYLPECQIIHLEGASFSFKESRERMYYESRRYFYNKHYNKFYCKICNDIHTVVLLISYITSKIIRPRLSDYYKQKLQVFKCYK